jgi:polysaccharide pyruvyl transferase WcaK-like protein
MAAGTPLVLAPQTIGPFSRRWTREIARRLMRRCHTVVSRDALSTGFVRELDPAIPLLEATDVAFRLPYDRPGRGESGPARVGINVSGLLYNAGARETNAFGLSVDYRAVMRELIARFKARPECRVHLFSHVIVPRRFEGVAEDDHRVAEQLADEFDVILEPAYGSPQETKSHIAGMDFFCGSRMHACIAAFSAGVPTVPIAYSRKFLGLFRTLGYPHVADGRTDTAEAIIAKVEEGYARRQALHAEVAESNAEAGRRLDGYRRVARDCLRDALAARLPSSREPAAA